MRQMKQPKRKCTVTRQIVGKPCEFLIKYMNVSANTPADLSAIIGLKFTFTINININSYYSRERIFNVSSIIEAHGKQQAIMDVQKSVEHEDPKKLDDLPFTLTTQESHATAMKKLSTGGTSLVRILYLHIVMF
jgi:hypothetical protein